VLLGSSKSSNTFNLNHQNPDSLDSTCKIICDRERLVERLPYIPRPLVFTNGCFDILHRGHVDYLTRAAALGNFLLVGVNSDDSVRRLNKGTGRPLNSLDDRMIVLASMACVDGVVSFDDDDPLELIQLLAPNHLVKGGDWEEDQIVGGKFVSQIGGQVHSIPFYHHRSTTDLIRRIQTMSATE